MVSSASSSNVCVLTAKNDFFYEKLLSLGQVPYIKFNSFTKQQTTSGNLRIKSIKCPIITINVTDGEPENIDKITEELAKQYIKFGGEGTKVFPQPVTHYVEYFRDGKLCKDKTYTGEIRLTITLPPGVDKELPT